MHSNSFYSAILALVILQTGKCDDPKDSERVDGTWLGSKAELSGKPFPEELTRTIRITVEKGTYKVAHSGIVEEGTFKLDSSTRPKSLDMTGTNGQNKGKQLLAIYELDGDNLKVCYDLTGKNRPKEFKTTEGSQQYLVIYKREKQ
jgi:uncharacterized protein (TIGR03067 family)